MGNAALTTTTHAEMNAIATAVADREGSLKVLLVLTETDPPAFPCSTYRQSLIDFDRGEMLILSDPAVLKGLFIWTKFALLPGPDFAILSFISPIEHCYEGTP